LRPSEENYLAGALAKLPPEETDFLPRKKDGTINAYELGIAAKYSAH
jgi:hypothetical protein